MLHDTVTLRTKALRYILTEEDWIDVRITKNITTKDLVKFSINLSSIINEKTYSVIRYDNAHGFTHIDRYGDKKKEVIKGKTKAEIVNMARADITRNWKTYRKKVEQLLEVEKHEK